jgi:hypothetical protein
LSALNFSNSPLTASNLILASAAAVAALIFLESDLGKNLTASYCAYAVLASISAVLTCDSRSVSLLNLDLFPESANHT